MNISVFVTYCWDNEEHENRVLSLTNKLREAGFHAENDKFKSQEETTIDFIKMMNQGMTSYDKVIIVLSENYKLRAENFTGGVGIEYQLIIKDIITKPNKYILVSFDGIKDSITPLSLMGRDVVDLSKGEGELTKLYGKLMDVKPIIFSEVGSQLPVIEQKNIQELVFAKPLGLELEKIEESFGNDYTQGGVYKWVVRKLTFYFKNKSGKTIDGCQFDINIDPTFIYQEGYGEVPDFNTSINTKIFANQTIKTEPIPIKVADYNIVNAGKSNITVTVYSELGETIVEKGILDCITINKNYTKTRIELDDFGR